MGASRKLQGEIDRVLKKVQEGVDVFDSIWNKVYDTENANQKEKFEADLKKEIKKLQRYRDQIKTWIQSSEIKDKKALMDARKQIEREMERFKVCEKETKTKAFSKEGLGLQPKTDPKEKAKSETRDWLNNVVGDLELQVENFEAEVEALSVKKGKTRPPRLVHLETSILRHKAHITKLELILRLLDNDELSAEQVNDVKDFVDDYVERNQDDFDEFGNVDELYSSLPLEKVESLEEFSTSSSSAFAKGVGAVSGAPAAVSLKIPVAPSAQGSIAPGLPSQQSNSTPDQVEEAGPQENTSDSGPRVTPSKTGIMGPSVTSLSVTSSVAPTNLSTAINGISRTSAGDTTSAAVLSGPVPVRGVMEISTASSSLVNPPSSGKDDEVVAFVGRKQSPAPSEMLLGKGLGKVPTIVGVSSQASIPVPVNLVSVGGNSTIGALGSVPAVDLAKRNPLSSDERLGIGSLVQPVISSLNNNRVLIQQPSKANDSLGPVSTSNIVENPSIGGRVFQPSMVSNVQWRPQSMSSFQSQTEGQFRGRTEITPDQKEKYLQLFQQVQQQGPSNLLSAPHILSASQKQFPGQQPNTILQQFSAQSSPSQVGLGGVQLPGAQQQNSVYQQPLQPNIISTGPKDADSTKVEEQTVLNSSEDLHSEARPDSASDKNIEEDLKSSYSAMTSTAEVGMLSREVDLSSPKKPLQGYQPSNVGVIGRRSIPDIGAIGDSISASGGNSGGLHDHAYNLQMLEAAYNKIPQPKDSERVKNYIPRNPAVTPSSYPQVQAPVVNNPLFWERLGSSNVGTDTLFFAFYYQQNTYQQYLAARELKKQSWRYHRKYSTWFQRHEEPQVTTDDYEQGTYVYFDFHIADDLLQQGWCQRVKTDFTFEYSYLEDELVV